MSLLCFSYGTWGKKNTSCFKATINHRNEAFGGAEVGHMWQNLDFMLTSEAEQGILVAAW